MPQERRDSRAQDKPRRDCVEPRSVCEQERLAPATAESTSQTTSGFLPHDSILRSELGIGWPEFSMAVVRDAPSTPPSAALDILLRLGAMPSPAEAVGPALWCWRSDQNNMND